MIGQSALRQACEEGFSKSRFSCHYGDLARILANLQNPDSLVAIRAVCPVRVSAILFGYCRRVVAT